MRRLPLVLLGLCVAAALGRGAEAADPYRWLEAIDDPRALTWVNRHNAATARRLSAAPEYDDLYAAALGILDAATRLPEVTIHGDYLYDFWRDRQHPRGIVRRATLAEFRRPAPAWQTVLDVDALARLERQPWAFNGVTWRESDPHRCLIRLSPGGGDAFEAREFNLDTLAFVDGGFVVPVAKSRLAWAGADALLVATDFGAGSLTTAGYPRTVKLWRRGTPLAGATTLHTGAATSVSVSGRRFEAKEGDIDLVTEELTFWTSRHWQVIDGQLVPLAIPETAIVVDAFRGDLVLWLKRDWDFAGVPFPAGSVVIANPAALRGEPGGVERIVAPTDTAVVTGVNVTPAGVLVTFLDNVRGRLMRYVPTNLGWEPTPVALPDNGAVTVESTDYDTGDAFVRFESFLTPPTLYYLPANAPAPTANAGATAALVPEVIKAEAPTFDASKFTVEQLWATSADGTRIPYFLVAPKTLKRDGSTPVWMFSYGGFETSLTPSYSGSYEELHGAYGKLWLERGGAFVLANIRGGGEFGPRWHQAALKQNHVKAFEDFEAVARDLEARKITSPAHLGIEGRSNGGLLVASTMLRHPELYGAVVCGSPLLDMQRYHLLLAGASWVAEYGNPDDPAEWSYLSQYSPYQNVRPGLKLPPVMFYTSTRDDRVHPGHARKMAAKMEALRYPVEYFEITEGGHHGSVTNEQLATRIARTFTFLWEHVGQGKTRD